MPPIPTSRTLLFTDEINRSSLRHIRSELQGVPISQSYASMRLGLANFARLWSAMNAVTFTRETNPNDTHRIVGARLDSERLPSSNSLECVSRIVAISRILLYSRYFQGAAWGWLLLTSDGRRIICQQFPISVEPPSAPAWPYRLLWGSLSLVMTPSVWRPRCCARRRQTFRPD